MQEATSLMNLEIPVGYVLGALLAGFVAWRTGANAIGGIKNIAGKFAPGSVAALVMFAMGITSIGYSTGDMLARSGEQPAAATDVAGVQWLSNDELLSLKDVDEDNARLILEAHKAQNKSQQDFYAKVQEEKAKVAETTASDELKLLPTGVSTGESVAPVDFTLLGADDPTVDATQVAEVDTPIMDKPQVPIQGTVSILAAGLALLICGVVTFIRQGNTTA